MENAFLRYKSVIGDALRSVGDAAVGWEPCECSREPSTNAPAEDAELARDLDYLSDADDLLDRERGEVVE